ncbi:hypothetical protein DEU38_1363 [Rhodococcus sp. AG1013]|uniref:hypothetical protein n=1 Tax=Rhodococcus sp. AG1013 TaxID=2183996 RepID=UPI000E0C7016|nr:hypothetical protein [Rhodococcus sp. AG1013]RDI12352.1 hypothetical protein DEU38_1363 [Rhodococcus sp. AG1013]
MSDGREQPRTGPAADDEERSEPHTAWDLAFGIGVPLGLLVGACVAVFCFGPAVVALQHALDVPELSPVPTNQRRPGEPGPTAMYWVTWFVPPLLVFACVAALWVWRLARPFAPS